MSRYVGLTVSVEADDVVERVDREHPDPTVSRIVNLRVGPLTLMFGRTDEETEAGLAVMLHALTELHSAVVARLAAE